MRTFILILFFVVTFTNPLFAKEASTALEQGLAAYERQDYATAVRLWMPLAKAGDAQAEANVGVMYVQGQGVTKEEANIKVGIRFIASAAGKGLMSAQSMLGSIYEKGRIVVRDDVAAAKWFRLAAEQGDATAQYNLSGMYEKGRGIGKDPMLAAKFLRLAAEQGFGAAQFNLGAYYARGVGVPKDLNQAAQWYRKAADQGLPDAQNNLGLLYFNGNGVAKNLAESARLFEKSAAQGYAVGEANLGLAYLNGDGVRQDFSLARMWLERAIGHAATEVEPGDADTQGSLAQAQLNLGYMYASAKGVARNYEKAIAYFRQAAVLSDAAAFSNLAYAYHSGSGVQKNDSMAFTYYALAMRFGDNEAQAKRDDVGKNVAPDERSKAQRRAEVWQPGQPLP
jgi:uncharacterized protein